MNIIPYLLALFVRLNILNQTDENQFIKSKNNPKTRIK
jgi:hypothetical protein